MHEGHNVTMGSAIVAVLTLLCVTYPQVPHGLLNSCGPKAMKTYTNSGTSITICHHGAQFTHLAPQRLTAEDLYITRDEMI